MAVNPRLQPELFDQALGLDARERVERAERLVEEHHARVVNERAREGHALALAS